MPFPFLSFFRKRSRNGTFLSIGALQRGPTNGAGQKYQKVTDWRLFCFVLTILRFFERFCNFWALVDPIVADPVRQDNDKRNNLQIYTEIPYQSTQREGTKLPNIHILSLSCRTGSPTTGSTGCRKLFGGTGHFSENGRNQPSHISIVCMTPCHWTLLQSAEVKLYWHAETALPKSQNWKRELLEPVTHQNHNRAEGLPPWKEGISAANRAVKRAVTVKTNAQCMPIKVGSSRV